MEFDEIFLEILNEYIKGNKSILEKYINKYPQYKEKILSKIQTAEFIKNNLQEEDLSGKKLGEYIILEELGRGGMGIVFLAIHSGLSRLTAVKVLPPSFVADQEALDNFKNEAKIIAKFNHPNIVPIYSIGSEKALHYIAMGYMPGPSLKDIIKKLKEKDPRSIKTNTVKEIIQGNAIDEKDISQKSITLKRGFKFWDKDYYQFVATIGAEIAGALSYAHQNGIFHGDLKPSNILLTNDAIPMIVDFGLSKDIKQLSSTKTNEFSGTLTYAAPEQIKENIISEKTDIWSLGVTLYELLTFRNPFEENTIKDTVDSILKANPIPPRSHDKKIPVDLETIIFKCLENKAEDRYSSIAEVSKDLKNYLESKPLKAKPVPISIRVKKWINRHRAISLLISGLIFSLLVLSLLYFNKRINDLISQGVFYTRMERYNAALVRYKKAINLLKWYPFGKSRISGATYRIGDIYYDKDEHYKAINYYRKALDLGPTKEMRTDLLWGLGRTYNYYKDEYDKAIDYYRKALEMKPAKDSHISILHEIGEAYYSKNEYDKAIDCYEKALGLKPNKEAHINIAWTIADTYFANQKFDKAIDYYNRTLELESIKDYRITLLTRIGDTYYEKNEYDQALNYYKKALELDPAKINRIILFEGIGATYREKGIYNEALSWYNKILELDPNPLEHIETIEDLRNITFEQGSYDETIKYTKQLMALHPPATRTDYYWLGISFSRKGLIDKALENLHEALKMTPKDMDTLHEILLAISKKKFTKKSDIEKYLQKIGFSEKLISNILEMLK